MSEPPNDSDAGRADLRPGDTLRDGRYAITGKLGEGGQGTTFGAVDKREGRAVTIKRFRVRGASSWKEVELAEREAKVLAHVSHPNLPVYVDHFEETGSLYLVTERIDGRTVAEIRGEGPMSEDDVLGFLRDAAAALDYLHGRAPPLVHRDIKPSNVIRRPDGSFAIIDFGAVRDRLKVTGSTVVGTFGYMAPEQFQGRAMPASDVYATGTTAIAMLTGREPEDLPHKGLAIDVEAALGRTARPELVRALVAMVEPDPDKRAPRLSTLLADLGPAPRARARDSAPPRASRAHDAPRTPAWTDDADLRRAVDEAGDQVRRVAEELGTQVRRVVDEVTSGRVDLREIKREARRAAEIAKRETRKAAEAARKEARRARKEARRAAKEEQRSESVAQSPAGRRPRDERPRPPGAPLGGPVLLVVLIALTIAQLAVLLALRVITPVVLFLVSLLFFGSIPGRAVRNAAGHVSAAGKRAVAAIGRAKDVVRGRPPVDATAPTVVHGADPVDPHARTEVSTVGHAPPAGPATVRARIEDDDAPAAVRITDPSSHPDTHVDPATAAAEEEALLTEEAQVRQSPPRDRRAR